MFRSLRPQPDRPRANPRTEGVAAMLSQLRLPGHTTNARTAKPPRCHGRLTASVSHADTSTLHPHEQRRQETNHPNPEPTRSHDPYNTGNARL